MILIGIDTGTKTGVAVMTDSKLTAVETKSIIGAMELVKYQMNNAQITGRQIKLYIEDARKRKWFGKNANAKKQGAGSIKRDSKIWEEFCIYHGIAYELVAPKDSNTKLPADTFKRLTGWQGRTSQHARDAVMLVWGRKR